MNRIGVAGGRNIPANGSAFHRRGRSFGGGDVGGAKDEGLNLDLFSKRRIAGSGGQDVMKKSSGQVKSVRSPMEDLLDSEMGKHDYDWLLTPPGSPHVPSDNTNANKNPVPATAPKRTPAVRSVSTTRTSRLSASQTENVQSVRPARSSSVNRGSISSSYASNNNKTSVLNTSSASVTSRPSTPSKRPSTPSAKTSAPTNHTASRSQTPAKTRPATSSGIRTGPVTSQNSRPVTPTSRSRITNNSTSSNTSITRTVSRSSTPTRVLATRTTPSGTAAGRSPSVGRTRGSNTQTPQSAPSSRPSSPSPRPRAPVRPIDLPDFPNDTPPNLRTKMPERPLSAGRSRPGAALTVRSTPNAEAALPPNSNRRVTLPVVSRSKFPENPSKVPLRSIGHQIIPTENQKTAVSDAVSRKTAKPAGATESTGFGRTISKKSLDMALRHMDIRQSLGGIRGASLFPHSIRSTALKAKPARMSDPVVPVNNDDLYVENDSCNKPISGETNGVPPHIMTSIVHSPNRENLIAMDNDLDLYGNYKHDTLLLREDLKSTSWLHSIDVKSDQSSVFDHRFEPLPEPFDPL